MNKSDIVTKGRYNEAYVDQYGGMNSAEIDQGRGTNSGHKNNIADTYQKGYFNTSIQDQRWHNNVATVKQDGIGNYAWQDQSTDDYVEGVDGNVASSNQFFIFSS